MVTIIDPHIKNEDSYHVSSQARELDLFVKNSRNSVFEGWCWPGNSNWIDYLNPAGLSYWSNLFKFDVYSVIKICFFKCNLNMIFFRGLLLLYIPGMI
jgi:mannosyl-oligosaccharide alpha-1,3-glucosidase